MPDESKLSIELPESPGGFVSKLRRALANKVVAALAGGILTGGLAVAGLAYVFLKGQVDDYIVKTVANEMDRSGGALNASLDRVLRASFSKRVGIIYGDRFDLTISSSHKDLPFLVAPKHHVWLVFRIDDHKHNDPKVNISVGEHRIPAVGDRLAQNEVHVVAISDIVDDARR